LWFTEGVSSEKEVNATTGQGWVGVEIDALTAATRFTLDLGGILEVRRLRPNQDADLWTLYTPTDHTLSVRGDGKFSYQHSNAKDQWEALCVHSAAKEKRA